MHNMATMFSLFCADAFLSNCYNHRHGYGTEYAYLLFPSSTSLRDNTSEASTSSANTSISASSSHFSSYDECLHSNSNDDNNHFFYAEQDEKTLNSKMMVNNYTQTSIEDEPVFNRTPGSGLRQRRTCLRRQNATKTISAIETGGRSASLTTKTISATATKECDDFMGNHLSLDVSNDLNGFYKPCKEARNRTQRLRDRDHRASVVLAPSLASSKSRKIFPIETVDSDELSPTLEPITFNTLVKIYSSKQRNRKSFNDSGSMNRGNCLADVNCKRLKSLSEPPPENRVRASSSSKRKEDREMVSASEKRRSLRLNRLFNSSGGCSNNSKSTTLWDCNHKNSNSAPHFHSLIQQNIVRSHRHQRRANSSGEGMLIKQTTVFDKFMVRNQFHFFVIF